MLKVQLSLVLKALKVQLILVPKEHKVQLIRVHKVLLVHQVHQVFQV